MLTERLKEGTKAAHQDLEKLIIRKIKELKSEQEYARLLNSFYGYIAAIEFKIAPLMSAGGLSDFAERRKAESLKDDIKTFDPAAALLLCQDIPELLTYGQAIGALYVLEGSTLGGKYITKMIAEKLTLQPEQGFKFFKSYEERTDFMWEEFKLFLNTLNPEPQVLSEIADSANQTFLKFYKWLNTP